MWLRICTKCLCQAIEIIAGSVVHAAEFNWKWILSTRSALWPRICRKCVCCRGFVPDSTGGAQDALPDPLVGWGGDASTLAPPQTHNLWLRHWFSRRHSMKVMDTVAKYLCVRPMSFVSFLLRPACHTGHEYSEAQASVRVASDKLGEWVSMQFFSMGYWLSG